MTAAILRGDARNIPLADASVDLIVTSPPYFGLRSYTDGGRHYGGQIGAEATPQEYIAALLECTREWMRVLKPEGSIFVDLGDKYSGAQGQTNTGRGMASRTTSSVDVWQQTDPTRTGIPAKSLMLLPERYRIGCVDQLGLIARAVILWSKPNGMPESVTDRVRRSHEDWVHLTKQPRYFSAVDEIREPTSGYSRPETTKTRGSRGGQKPRTMLDTCNPLGKLPGSVWTIATQPLKVPAALAVDHFAAFPMEWPRRIISGWSPSDGVVLDPFGGTGTAALVADTIGRRGISVDRSADYGRLARWRTTNPGERARALGVAKPPPVMDGQGDLFEAAS
jgi:site-specific DNA-methyltransferase (cytosine-N4-specific)